MDKQPTPATSQMQFAKEPTSFFFKFFKAKQIKRSHKYLSVLMSPWEVFGLVGIGLLFTNMTRTGRFMLVLQ